MQIGAVTVLMSPENVEVTPDDRINQVKTIGGAFTLDLGRFEQGDHYSLSDIGIKNDDWLTITGYWVNRTPVTIVDRNGLTRTNMLIKITKWQERQKFKTAPYVATIEYWAKT
jgi:hypothetical protein